MRNGWWPVIILAVLIGCCLLLQSCSVRLRLVDEKQSRVVEIERDRQIAQQAANLEQIGRALEQGAPGERWGSVIARSCRAIIRLTGVPVEATDE